MTSAENRTRQQPETDVDKTKLRGTVTVLFFFTKKYNYWIINGTGTDILLKVNRAERLAFTVAEQLHVRIFARLVPLLVFNPTCTG